jgi:hypothetical protein
LAAAERLPPKSQHHVSRDYEVRGDIAEDDLDQIEKEVLILDPEERHIRSVIALSDNHALVATCTTGVPLADNGTYVRLTRTLVGWKPTERTEWES